MADWLAALILGLVEGLTEFIPVSSTGHMLLLGHFLGFESTGKTFEIVIQLGALLAIISVYFQRLWRLATRWPFDPEARRFLIGLLVAFLPAMVIGFLAYDFIKTVLFETPTVICVALIVGGVILLLLDRMKKAPAYLEADRYPMRVYFLIGLFQCLALWPGMSRSSSTILGGMLLGLDRKTAAEYSFFAAVPLLAAAALYELYKSRSTLSAADIPWFAVGFLVSYVFAWLAVRFFIHFLSRHTLAVFGWYRLAVAAATVAWALRG